MIKVSIDVTKLDKAKFVKGKKGGIWANLILFETPSDKFGNDFSVKQDQTKEEREAGEQLPFLGNGRWTGGESRPKPPVKKLPAPPRAEEPFEPPF